VTWSLSTDSRILLYGIESVTYLVAFVVPGLSQSRAGGVHGSSDFIYDMHECTVQYTAPERRYLETHIASPVKSIMGRAMAYLGPIMAGGLGVLTSNPPHPRNYCTHTNNATQCTALFNQSS
jgi:hypothetical protein